MADTYVGKPIGARSLTWFPMTADPDTGAPTYGEAVKLSRLINIVPTPVFSEGTLESDDTTEDQDSKLVAYDVTINASQLTDAIRATLLGHAIDEGAGLLMKSSDTAQEGALAWKELLSGPGETEKFKYVVLYKGKFKEFAETANTLTSSGLTYQTHNLTGRFYARNDGAVRYQMRDDSPSVNTTKTGAWFESPQEYTPKTEPGG